MANMKNDRESLLDLIKNLSINRKDQVLLQVKLEKLEEKKKLQNLAMRRLEARHINDVEQARDQNNQPLLTNEWSKRAAVEERLANDPQFTKVLIQHRLTCKAINRIVFKIGTLQVTIDEMESKEKVLLTV